MMHRLVRTSFAAVRRLSTEAAAVASAPKPAKSSEVTTKTSRTTKSGGSGGGGKDTLGRRLLSLTYTKRKADITIRKWKEDGKVVDKFELIRVVRELRKLKRYKHALEVCEWMRIQDDMKLHSGDYAIHLDLIAKLRGKNRAEKFFEDLPDTMKDHATYTALLHTYVQHKDLAKAEDLMKKMSECGFLNSPLPYNHLLTLYISMGQLEKVKDLLRELSNNTSPDIVTYNLWLRVCSLQNDVETAEKIYLALKEAKIEPDWFTYSTLTSIYIKNSLKEKATATVKEMEKRISKNTRVGYSSLISLHTQLKNTDDVVHIWKKMKSLYRKLNDAEYNCMISSLLKLGKSEDAEKLYAEWVSVSPTRDTRISNLLLAAYVNNNPMEKAETYYNQMIEKGIRPSYTTWELLTWGYLKEDQLNKALDCFKKMIGSVEEWKPDEKMVNEILRILEEHGDFERAEELLITLRGADHVNTVIYNSLLRTYAKAGKMPLIIAERMKADNVQLDEETRELIEVTSKLCVAEVPKCLSQ